MGLDDAIAQERARLEYEKEKLRRVARCDAIIADTERTLCAALTDAVGRLAARGNPGVGSIEFWLIPGMSPARKLPPRWRRTRLSRQGWWLPPLYGRRPRGHRVVGRR